MHATCVLQLLAAASVSQASWFFNFRLEPRDDLFKRQNGSNGADVSKGTDKTPTSSTTPAKATPTPPITSTTLVVITTTATPSPVPGTNSDTPVPATAPAEQVSLSSSKNTPTPVPGDNVGSNSQISGSSVTPSVTLQPITSTIRTVITTTNSAGEATAITTESTVTQTPGLNAVNTGGSSSGMSDQTRNTVIGVVVGVGGTIVLCALGFVAWRIWGKKRQVEENDGLMEYNNHQLANEPKTEVGSPQGTGRTPFQSTLETYHAPNQVNASSNF